MPKFILILLALSLSVQSLWAQADLVEIRLYLQKKDYLADEVIKVTVELKNNGARDMRMSNSQQGNWLEFKIDRNGGNDVSLGRKVDFAETVIPAGKSIKHTIPINSIYPMKQQGNYTVRAVVHPPSGIVKKASEPRFLNVVDGATIFQKEIGVKDGSGQVVRYKIINLNLLEADQLYFQSIDVGSGRVLSTFSLGNYTRISKPKFIIGANGNLNGIYQLTLDKFRFITVNPAGTLLAQEIHQATPTGSPFMAHNPKNGTIMVRNSLIFDEKIEKEKKLSVHKMSQRPPFAY